MTAAAIHNETGRRWQLERFGYNSRADLPQIWRQLRSDFTAPHGRAELSDLVGDGLAEARRYCSHRASLDGLMDRCDEIHLQILQEGPEPVLVETYAAARDEYEDAVERFGELRRAVQAAFDRSV